MIHDCDNLKVSQIAGFLGSGKTTALMKIVDELMQRGDLVAIVVNDVGDISVDAKFVEAHGLKVKEISGGCICCQHSNLLRTLRTPSYPLPALLKAVWFLPLYNPLKNIL